MRLNCIQSGPSNNGDCLTVWSQDFRTEPYTVWSHQIMGTVLQSSPKNLRPDRNFLVRSGLDRKLQSGPASLIVGMHKVQFLETLSDKIAQLCKQCLLKSELTALHESFNVTGP